MITPIGYCVWISPTKLAACAKRTPKSFPVYSDPVKSKIEFCACMAGPNDPDPECKMCGGTGHSQEYIRLAGIAPELLECLKDARRLLTDQDAIDLAHIDEVIAKAEGAVA